jgi:hypothetical protein
MTHVRLEAIDYLIVLVYFALVIEWVCRSSSV